MAAEAETGQQEVVPHVILQNRLRRSIHGLRTWVSTLFHKASISSVETMVCTGEPLLYDNHQNHIGMVV